MRIAICFSGQIRTGIEASKNIKHFIGELLPHCDFFIHTWANDTHRGLSPDEIGFDVFLDENVFEKIKEIYSPKVMVVENYFTKMEEIKVKYPPPSLWFSWFYSWMKSVEYKKEYEELNGFTYDYVIKLRPDCIYSPDVKLSDFLGIIAPGVFITDAIWLSGNGSNHDPHRITTDDMLFISDSKTMDIASKWMDNYPKTYASDNLKFGWGEYEFDFFVMFLNLNGIYVTDYLRLTYNENISVYRPESLQYDPIKEYKKCFDIDRHFYYVGNYALKNITIDEFKRDAELILNNRGIVPEWVVNLLKENGIIINRIKTL